MSSFDSAAVKKYLLELQNLIVARLEQVDGQPFRRDSWDRPPASATAHRPGLTGRQWEAMGVSLVLHPRNPYAPTAHANVRMFVATKDGEAPVFWFGGSMDMTPYYGFKEDAVHFH